MPRRKRRSKAAMAATFRRRLRNRTRMPRRLLLLRRSIRRLVRRTKTRRRLPLPTVTLVLLPVALTRTRRKSRRLLSPSLPSMLTSRPTLMARRLSSRPSLPRLSPRRRKRRLKVMVNPSTRSSGVKSRRRPAPTVLLPRALLRRPTSRPRTSLLSRTIRSDPSPTARTCRSTTRRTCLRLCLLNPWTCK